MGGLPYGGRPQTIRRDDEAVHVIGHQPAGNLHCGWTYPGPRITQERHQQIVVIGSVTADLAYWQTVSGLCWIGIVMLVGIHRCGEKNLPEAGSAVGAPRS